MTVIVLEIRFYLNKQSL